MHVLIVDDNRGVRDALALLFRVHDIEARTASTPEEALVAARNGEVGVVIQDMNFREAATSGDEGVALFRALRAVDVDLPVLLMTAWSDVATAVALVREGADDYIEKPWDDRALVGKVRTMLAARRVRRDRGAEPDPASLAGLVYASAEMHAVVALALRAAPSDVPVLLTGPSGTGKERVAQLVRASSARRDKPFVAVNAGALPPSLIEAELFGAEPGAFTGATGSRKGRFEAADRGTLFLDEVGLLSPNGQAALLRVLQTGEYQRLGSSTTRSCDVRVIAATNENLAAGGRFREDLYYRLAVMEISIPALRERPADIEPLAAHFLQTHGLRLEVLDGTARRAMAEHGWPGNVRELENRIRRAVLTRSGEKIGVAELGLSTESARPPSNDGPPSERAAIEQALRASQGVVSRAAEALGLSRQALYRRMERLGFKLERRLK